MQNDILDIEIIGSISTENSISGAITQKEKLSGMLASAYTTERNPYTGEYEVVPSSGGTTLDTKEKFLKNNITVHPIPYYEVPNTSGGTTVYIAGKLEIE